MITSVSKAAPLFRISKNLSNSLQYFPNRPKTHPLKEPSEFKTVIRISFIKSKYLIVLTKITVLYIFTPCIFMKKNKHVGQLFYFVTRHMIIL